jgi:lipopolysaccharide export system ATP-binding protein
MHPNKLVAENLVKVYKKRRVVQGVSLSVESSSVVGLLGPNGAGKTTCFYMIIGLVAPDSGEIKLNQQILSSAPLHVRAQAGIGYLPQEASIFRKLSAEDNILAILETRKDLTKINRQEKLEQLLEEFNLTHVRNTLGMSLSGGERRRVEISRALACDPKFILLDEPFAGVDPISVNDIKQQIRHLAKRGIGILITDHNVRETLDICDKAYIVSEGKVISEGSPDAVLQCQTVRDVYLGDSFVL